MHSDVVQLGGSELPRRYVFIVISRKTMRPDTRLNESGRCYRTVDERDETLRNILSINCASYIIESCTPENLREVGERACKR